MYWEKTMLQKYSNAYAFIFLAGIVFQSVAQPTSRLEMVRAGAVDLTTKTVEKTRSTFERAKKFTKNAAQEIAKRPVPAGMGVGAILMAINLYGFVQQKRAFAKRNNADLNAIINDETELDMVRRLRRTWLSWFCIGSWRKLETREGELIAAGGTTKEELRQQANEESFRENLNSGTKPSEFPTPECATGTGLGGAPRMP